MEASMQHITQSSGLSVQAPNPSAMIRTTITARAAAQKSSTKSSITVQNSHSKRYIIYIMENKNSKINNSLTHLK